MIRRFFLLYAVLLLGVLAACSSEPAPADLTRIANEVRATTVAELSDSVEAAAPDESPATAEPVATPEREEDPDPTAETVEVEVTRVVTSTVAPPALGTAARPLRVIFAPSLERQVTEFRGGALVEAISDTLGLETELLLPESFAATVDALCAAPDQSIGFMPALVYTLARERCNAQSPLVAERFDYGVQASMIVIGANSGITQLEQLSGLRWAVDDLDSIANGLYFQALFQAQGIEPAGIVETQSDSSSILALLNGEADFATASFTPPLLPRLERQWEYGENDPETWRQLGIPASRHPIGFIIVLARAEDGGYQIRDARSAVFDVAPGVFATTRILDLSAPLPNDAVVFGPDISLGNALTISEFLRAYGESDACQGSVCSGDSYNWTGFTTATGATFAPLDFIGETLDLTEEELLSLYDE